MRIRKHAMEENTRDFLDGVRVKLDPACAFSKEQLTTVRRGKRRVRNDRLCYLNGVRSLLGDDVNARLDASLSRQYRAVELYGREHSLDVTRLQTMLFGLSGAIAYQRIAMGLFDTESQCLVMIAFIDAYGDDAPQPYQGSVYLSAIDSVRDLVSGVHRSALFQSFMDSIFSTLASRAYSRVYMWVCPPLEGRSLVFVNGEEDETRIPFSKLRIWYDRLFSSMECVDGFERAVNGILEGNLPPVFAGDILEYYIAEGTLGCLDASFTPFVRRGGGEFDMEGEMQSVQAGLERTRADTSPRTLRKRVCERISRSTLGRCQGQGYSWTQGYGQGTPCTGGWRNLMSCAGASAAVTCCGTFGCPDALWELKLCVDPSQSIQKLVTGVGSDESVLSSYMMTNAMLARCFSAGVPRGALQRAEVMTDAIASEMALLEPRKPPPGAGAPRWGDSAGSLAVAAVEETPKVHLEQLMGGDLSAAGVAEFESLGVAAQNAVVLEVRRLETERVLRRCARGFLDCRSGELERVRLRRESSGFVEYRPRVDHVGRAYVGATLFESEELASMRFPEVRYTLSVPADEQAIFSSAQVDFAIQAGFMHTSRRTEAASIAHHRKGVVLADGTGTGKTWCAMLTILDNLHLALARRSPSQAKCLWVSSSEFLRDNVRSELQSLWNERLPATSPLKERGRQYCIERLEDVDPTYLGIAFVTYKQLSRQGARVKTFLGPPFASEAMIVFDEIHSANSGDERSECTLTRSVLELQQLYCNARFMYLSATPISHNVDRLRAFTRIGLWGNGTCFDSFESFKRDVFGNSSREAGSLMELLALELKGSGQLFCRDMPQSAESRELLLPLEESQRLIYDGVVGVLRQFRAVLIAEGDGPSRAKRCSEFMNDAKHAVTLLLASFKAQNILPWLRARVEEGYAVVIAIQNTGEKRAASGADVALNSGGCLDRLQKWYLRVRESAVSRFENDAAAWESFLSRLPMHALDVVLQGLGEHSVAEISGRQVRVRSSAEGPFLQTFDARRQSEVELAHFTCGRKHVAVLSEAGSNGTRLSSLPGDTRQRLFVLLQASDKATTTLQQFGRVHRNGQSRPPVYVFPRTDVPIELRFLAELQSNLCCLGAAVSGARGAAGPMRDLLEFDLYSEHAHAAVQETRERHRCKVDALIAGSPCSRESHAATNTFLNACMLLDLDTQGVVFDDLRRSVFRHHALRHAAAARSRFDSSFLDACILHDPRAEERGSGSTREAVRRHGRDCLEACEVPARGGRFCGLTVRSFDVGVAYSFVTASTLEGRFYVHAQTRSPLKAVPCGERVFRALCPDIDVRGGYRFLTDETLRCAYEPVAEDDPDLESQWQAAHLKETQSVHLVEGPWLHAWPSLRSAIGRNAPVTVRKLRFTQGTVIGVELHDEALKALKAHG